VSAQVLTHPHALTPTAELTLPAAMHLARRLGKYTLGDTLGEGAMGVVYRAVDPHIDRVVALKTIRKSVLESAAGNLSAALRFRNEARAAGRLSHPGIVSIYEYGEEGEQSFIAMEYVEGASLLRCTAPQQRLPLEDVLSVMTQLLHALNYAHAHGVWHRDIKPSNLIVTAGGQLKVTDFGIARIDAAALTQDASIMGSCGYMAPECYRGIELDQRVDLFACGVLLYELLTGRRPFAGLPGAVMHQMLHDEPPPLVQAGCSAAEAAALAPFEPIVVCAMAKDRAQRYPGAQEMLDALTEVAAKPIAARVSVAAVQRMMAPHAAAAAPAPATVVATEVVPPAPAPAVVHMLPRKPQPIYRPVVAPVAPVAAAASAIEAAAASLPSPAPAAVLAPASPPTAPPTAPPTTPPDTTHFEPAALAKLEALLVPTLGPVARVVVRRAAAKSPALGILVARLAHELTSAEERRHFLAQAQQAFGRAETSGTEKPQASDQMALPVLGSTPLQDAAVQRAERALMRHVGPIACWMVKTARAKSGSREQFIATLAELAADCIDPESLAAELEKTV
jgi:eukaryotic-like serine/threonine-protein kinase